MMKNKSIDIYSIRIKPENSMNVESRSGQYGFLIDSLVSKHL